MTQPAGPTELAKVLAALVELLASVNIATLEDPSHYRVANTCALAALVARDVIHRHGLEERLAAAVQARMQNDDARGCEACGGTGAVYEHAPSCESDLCAGNGDEHSCRGAWVPCEIETNEVRAPPESEGSMTIVDLYLLRENRSVESIAPTVYEALEWADEHVNLDRLTLNDVLAAFAAGYRYARDEESSDGC